MATVWPYGGVVLPLGLPPRPSATVRQGHPDDVVDLIAVGADCPFGKGGLVAAVRIGAWPGRRARGSGGRDQPLSAVHKFHCASLPACSRSSPHRIGGALQRPEAGQVSGLGPARHRLRGDPEQLGYLARGHQLCMGHGPPSPDRIPSPSTHSPLSRRGEYSTDTAGLFTPSVLLRRTHRYGDQPAEMPTAPRG